MWLYPYLTWTVILFITFVLVVMMFRPAAYRSGFYRTVGDCYHLYGADYDSLEGGVSVAKTASAEFEVTKGLANNLDAPVRSVLKRRIIV